ncbi:rifin, partial [Plasmodium reichenowi]
MKVHYINILLFVIHLNILEHNQRNHRRTTPHTPKIPTNRSLCECELYAPVNYDKDHEMKEVMDNFNKQTQQRFHEYDERMKEKR